MDGKQFVTQIADINEQTMEGVRNVQNPTLEDYVAIDQESRQFARDLIKELN